MNTKVLAVMLVACIAFVLCVLCISIFRGSNNVIEDPLRGVVLEVKEDTVSNAGFTLVIKNVASNDYGYGQPYWVERKVGERWERVPDPYDVWTSELIILRGNSVTELEIELEGRFGELSAGDYRITKSFAYSSSLGNGVGEFYPISAEFRIDLPVR